MKIVPEARIPNNYPTALQVAPYFTCYSSNIVKTQPSTATS